MITVEEAHSIIRGSIPSPQAVSCPVRQGSGRVLARDILAPFPLPRFDNSAMDGFAVRWKDTERAQGDRPVTLRQIGTVSAGEPGSLHVGPGECAQVMTGAPIPEGADAVVMVEHTSGFSENDRVEIQTPARKGENIRFKGEEIEAGEAVLGAGRRIGPAEMGILASFGYEAVETYGPPGIALLATGTELKEAGETLDRGEIYNSNLPLLEELTHRVGGEVVSSQAVADDPVTLGESIEMALDSCDILVTSGGVSAGRFDLIRGVVRKLGVEERFHKVAQKPGKPLFFGTVDGTLVFGVPGNPVSAFVCFMEYVWPTCERWMGLDPEPKIEATLDRDFPRDSRKHRFLPGRVWAHGTEVLAAPAGKVGSHMLTSGVGANGILESPPGDGALSKGETVLVKLFPWASLAGML